MADRETRTLRPRGTPVPEGAEEAKDGPSEATSDGVTEVVVCRVRRGMEAAFQELEARLLHARERFPGFLESYTEPAGRDGDEWTVLLRFDTPEHLAAWMDSPERASLLRELQSVLDYHHAHAIRGSFPGWVPLDPGTGEAPPNWKTALLVLVGLYPIVSLTIAFVNPHLQQLVPSLVAFVGCCIGVLLTTWLTMPLLIRAFGWWLYPRRRGPGPDAAGVALLVVAFVGEIAAFSRLLD